MTRDQRERLFAARAWLRRHGFTAASLVEDLAQGVAAEHVDAQVNDRERHDADLSELVSGLRAWIEAAQRYRARLRGEG